MNVKPFDRRVQQLFESGFYRIPRFQRPYCWERENVEEFWSDLVGEAETEHFIGSIVVWKQRDSDTYHIVDGQQRLTTITLLLCALRECMKAVKLDKLAAGVQGFIERRDKENEPQFVIQPESSYPYLMEHVLKDGAPDVKIDLGPEERLLKAAFELLRENLTNAIKAIEDDTSVGVQAKPELVAGKLKWIRDRALNLKVIQVELDSEDDAYFVFETLNTRGKDLRVTDLFKTHLTRLLRRKNRNVDVVKDKWEQIVDTIESSQADISTDSFLHHYWLSKHSYVKEKRLYKELKQVVKDAGSARVLLDELVADSQTYRWIHETSYRRKWARDEDGLKRSLEALQLFKVKQDLPMVLAALRSYLEGGIRLKHVSEILRAIESFHFKFTAVTSQRSSGGISMMYALHARELSGATVLVNRIKTLKALSAKLRGKSPGLEEFQVDFAEIRYSRDYYTKQKKLVQYILEGLDRSLARRGVPADYSAMTIEHLSSENPSSASPKLKPEQTAEIGNLLYVGGPLNEELKNKPFAKKKGILLAASDVWVDDVIKGATVWGPEQIRKRSVLLAKTAYEDAWRL